MKDLGEHDLKATSTGEIRAAHFQREELWGMIRRAEVLAGSVPNPRWARAYADVAQSLSTLDAFLARSTVHVGTGHGQPMPKQPGDLDFHPGPKGN